MRLGYRDRLSSPLNLSGIACCALLIGKKHIFSLITLGPCRESQMGDVPISLHSSRCAFELCTLDSAYPMTSLTVSLSKSPRC